MKKVSTFILLVMILSFALFAFAGCNGDDRPPIITEEPDEDRNEDPDEERTEAPTEELEETSTTPVEDVTDAPVATTYTVTFNLNGGTLQSGELTQVVEEGKAATAPVAVNGHKTLTWDADFSCVTGDMTVNAVWEKVELTNVQLAEVGQKATVTIEVETINGYSSRGSGFFIGNDGTLITAFHVIEMAAEIYIITDDGAKRPLEKVISFNPVYDIAILKIDYETPNYLEICENAAKVGESVVAIGSALGELDGTVTYGYISSVKRMVGKIECIQTDAAISEGNSGGPLLNIYGEVIGMNCFYYLDGQNLNLAVKISMLDNIGEERNFDMSEMKRWYNTEASRSYSPYDADGAYYYSIVNNYDTVTGKKCVMCIDDDGDLLDGYHDMMTAYIYEYDITSYDKYIEYIRSLGFVYDDTVTDDGIYIEIYYNEKDGYKMTLEFDQSEDLLLIYMEKA